MKLGFFAMTIGILVAGCASAGDMNNDRADRILNRWDNRISTADVCGNQEYLSCVGISEQQCTAASSETGAHCKDVAKRVILSLGDNQGKEAFKTCVYTYHRNEVPGRTETGKFGCEEKIKTLWW